MLESRRDWSLSINTQHNTGRVLRPSCELIELYPVRSMGWSVTMLRGA